MTYYHVNRYTKSDYDYNYTSDINNIYRFENCMNCPYMISTYLELDTYNEKINIISNKFNDTDENINNMIHKDNTGLCLEMSILIKNLFKYKYTPIYSYSHVLYIESTKQLEHNYRQTAKNKNTYYYFELNLLENLHIPYNCYMKICIINNLVNYMHLQFYRCNTWYICSFEINKNTLTIIEYNKILNYCYIGTMQSEEKYYCYRSSNIECEYYKDICISSYNNVSYTFIVYIARTENNCFYKVILHDIIIDNTIYCFDIDMYKNSTNILKLMKYIKNIENVNTYNFTIPCDILYKELQYNTNNELYCFKSYLYGIFK